MKRFRIRNTIAIPIVLVLVLITVCILVSGYFVNRRVFYDVFEERERNKAKNIHLTIESLISREKERITDLAGVLTKDTDLGYGLYHYTQTRGDLKPLKAAMDQIRSQTKLDSFRMVDSGGRILYDPGSARPGGTLEDLDSFRRALEGKERLVASRLGDRWGLRSVVPIYVSGWKKPTGVLVLGTAIDNAFARMIAGETGSQVFLATADGVVAGSYDLADRRAIDAARVERALRGNLPVFHSDDRNDRFYTYVPLDVAGARFCLVIETDIRVVRQLLERNRRKMAEWGLILLLGISLVGVAMTFYLIRPLGRLREEARSIVREYTGRELPEGGEGNEIETLVRAIHLMVEAIEEHVAESERAGEALRQRDDQLRQAQKLEAVGKLAGGVAHDFNNLLSVITGYSELLLMQMESGAPGYAEIEEIHKAGDRGASLTRQLLAFSRRQVLRPVLLSLNDSVSSLRQMLDRLIPANIRTEMELLPELPPVEADPHQVDQILLNLAVNARDAMPDGGVLTFSTGVADLDRPLVEGSLSIPPGRWVTLEVRDTGCGMDAATLSRVFEPFFTTKAEGKGTGLGLATVYGIVAQSGGHLRVRSEVGKGTLFTVFLPPAEGKGREGEPEGRKGGRHAFSGEGTVLLVEGEDSVREMVRETLKGFGFAVVEARGGEEALAAARAHEGPIGLLVTDVVMEGMTGIQLAREIRKGRPGIRILYMSGYMEESAPHLGGAGQGASFLQKPVTPTSLFARLAEMFPPGSGTTAGRPPSGGNPSPG